MEQLNQMFRLVDAMKVAKINVSYIDEDLFTKNEETVNEIGSTIKTEGSNVMRTIAKKVLNKFWRYY